MSEPHGILDITCPLEPQHPVNRGLVGNWASVPASGWRGGVTMRDLVRGWRSPHDGTLTGMAFPATATSGWQGPRGRPGGYGCLQFDGTNDYVYCSVADYRSSDASGAISLWFRSGAAQGTLWASGDETAPSTFLRFWVNSDGSNFTLALQVVQAGSETRRIHGGTAVGDGAWHHGVLLSTGSAYGMYLDGKAETLNVLAGSNDGLWLSSIAGRDNVTAGALRVSSVANPLSGTLDDIRYYSNPLSVNEIRALYSESRLGYPEAWRWIKPTRIFSTGLDIRLADLSTTLDNVTLSNTTAVQASTLTSQTLENVSVSSVSVVIASASFTITLSSVTVSSSNSLVLTTASVSIPLDPCSISSLLRVSVDGGVSTLTLDSVSLESSIGSVVTASASIQLSSVTLSSLVHLGPQFPTYVWSEDGRDVTWIEESQRSIVWIEDTTRRLVWRIRSVPQTLVQRPNESAIYAYDFSRDAVIGATVPDPIHTVTSVVASLVNPDDTVDLPTLGTPSISTDGTEVLVEITAPSDNNVEYKIRFVVVTTAGYTRVGLGVLAVNED